MAQIKKYNKGGELAQLQSLEDQVKEAYASADASTQKKMSALSGTYMNYAASRTLRDRDAIRLEIDKNKRLLQIAKGELGYDPLSSRVASFNEFGYLSSDEIGAVGNQLARLTAGDGGNADPNSPYSVSTPIITSGEVSGSEESASTFRAPVTRHKRYNLVEGIDDLIPKVGATNKDKMEQFINLVQGNITKYMTASHDNEVAYGIGDLSGTQLEALHLQLEGIKTSLNTTGYTGTIFNNLVDILNKTGIADLKDAASSYFSDIIAGAGNASVAAGNGNGVISSSQDEVEKNEDVLRSNDITQLSSSDPYFDLVDYLDKQNLALRKHGSDYYLFEKGTTNLKRNYGRIIQLPWSSLRGQGIFTDKDGKVAIGDVSDGSALAGQYDVNAARTASTPSSDAWPYFRYVAGQTTFKDSNIESAFNQLQAILQSHGYGPETNWLDLSDYISDPGYYVGVLKSNITPEQADADVAGFNPNNFYGFYRIDPTTHAVTTVTADDLKAKWNNQGGTHPSAASPLFNGIDMTMSTLPAGAGYTDEELSNMWKGSSAGKGEINGSTGWSSIDLNIKDFFAHNESRAGFQSSNHGSLGTPTGYEAADDWYVKQFLGSDPYTNFVNFLVTYASHSLDIFDNIKFNGTEDNPFKLAFTQYLSQIQFGSDQEKKAYIQNIANTYKRLVKEGKIKRIQSTVRVNGRATTLDTGDPAENLRKFINIFLQEHPEVQSEKQGGILSFKVGGTPLPTSNTTTTSLAAGSTGHWDQNGNYQLTEQELANLGITSTGESNAENEELQLFTQAPMEAGDILDDPILVKRLTALGLDLTGTVASFLPGYGTAVSAGAGIASTGVSLWADLQDPTMSAADVAKEVGANLGLTLVGLIPSGGSIKAAKGLGKVWAIIKKSPRLLPYALGLLQEYGLSKDLIENLSDPNHRWTKEDASNAMLFISGILNFAQAGGNYHQTKVNQAGRINVADVETTKGTKAIDASIMEKVDAEGKQNGFDAANKLFKQLTGQTAEGAGLDKEAYKAYGTKKEAEARQKLSWIKRQYKESKMPKFEQRQVISENDPLKLYYEQNVDKLNNSNGLLGFLGFRPRTNYEMANGIGWGLNTMTDHGLLPTIGEGLPYVRSAFNWVGEHLPSLKDPREDLIVGEDGKVYKKSEYLNPHDIELESFRRLSAGPVVKGADGNYYKDLGDGKFKQVTKAEYDKVRKQYKGLSKIYADQLTDVKDPYNIKDNLFSDDKTGQRLIINSEGLREPVYTITDSSGEQVLVPMSKLDEFRAANPETGILGNEHKLDEQVLEVPIEDRPETNVGIFESPLVIQSTETPRSRDYYLNADRTRKSDEPIPVWDLENFMQHAQQTHLGYKNFKNLVEKHNYDVISPEELKALCNKYGVQAPDDSKLRHGAIMLDSGHIYYSKQGTKLTRLQNKINNK